MKTKGIFLSLVLVLSHPMWAATITVDNTTCNLVDAITAANTDAAVGGCAAGSGADTVELTADVLLSAEDHFQAGLPLVSSDITVAGGGFKIERVGGPDFRQFDVRSGGTLTLENLTLRGGRASQGGAISVNFPGAVHLVNTTVSDSYAGFRGGGIFSDY